MGIAPTLSLMFGVKEGFYFWLFLGVVLLLLMASMAYNPCSAGAITINEVAARNYLFSIIGIGQRVEKKEVKEPSGYNFGNIYKIEKGNEGLNRVHIGYYAVPSSYGELGIRSFIISNEREAYYKDQKNNKPITQWPAADPTTVEWSRYE